MIKNTGGGNAKNGDGNGKTGLTNPISDYSITLTDDDCVVSKDGDD